MNTDVLLEGSKVIDAIGALEKSLNQTIVVVSASGQLLGTVTDGDIRRLLLNEGSLDVDIDFVMNKSPITVDQDTSPSEILSKLHKSKVRCLPVIDSDGTFIRLVDFRNTLDHFSSHLNKSGFDFAVIMAGGEGLRLRPYTEKLPKPMVQVGGMPIIERQIEKLRQAGIKKIYISVNYLSEVIENYFEDGAKFGVVIQYLKEETKLGTGGSLSLLPTKPSNPILVMNGDVLNNVDYRALEAFHQLNDAKLTVAAVHHEMPIKFGVLRTSGVQIEAFEEKPIKRILCNAGIYVLSPELLALSLPKPPFNMTDLLENCISQKEKIVAFPIHEYWSDIGTPDDLLRARHLHDE